MLRNVDSESAALILATRTSDTLSRGLDMYVFQIKINFLGVLLRHPSRAEMNARNSLFCGTPRCIVGVGSYEYGE